MLNPQEGGSLDAKRHYMGVMKVSINLHGEGKPIDYKLIGVASDGGVEATPQRLHRMPIFTINLVE